MAIPSERDRDVEGQSGHKNQERNGGRETSRKDTQIINIVS